jgi:hypothetical protein
MNHEGSGRPAAREQNMLNNPQKIILFQNLT